MRPETLTKDFILRIIAATGKHSGIFQLIEFHEKKPNIFSCYISDGYFRLKVIFLDQAGVSIANGHIAVFSVLNAEVYNYSFEEGVYLVKSIESEWGYDRKVGDPKQWRHKRTNTNQSGSNIINWPSDSPTSIKVFTFGQKKSSGKKQKSLLLDEQKPPPLVTAISEVSQQGQHTNSSCGETQQLQPKSHSKGRPSLIIEHNDPAPRSSSSKRHQFSCGKSNDFKLQFQQASRLSSGQKKLLIDEEPPKSPANSFTEDDFIQLSEILSAQQSHRNSGAKKQRISTNSQSLNQLLQLLGDMEDEKTVELTLPTANTTSDQPPLAKNLTSPVSSTHKQSLKTTVDSKPKAEDNEGDLSELLKMMDALPSDRSAGPTELLKSPASKSEVTVHLQSNHKNDHDTDSQLEALLKEDEFDDLLAFMGNFQKTEVSVRKETKIKMEVVPLMNLYPDAEGWSVHVQILLKGEPSQRMFGSKSITSLGCMVRDSENSLVEAIFTDPSIYSLLQNDQYYYLENGCVCSTRNIVSSSLKFTLEFNAKLTIEAAPAFECQPKSLSPSYTPVRDVFNLPVDTMVHVVGILRDLTVVCYKKDGANKSRSTYILVDPVSSSEVELVDFGRIKTKIEKLRVVTVYNAKITKYREIKGLVVGFNTLIKEGSECQQTMSSLQEYCKMSYLDSLVPTYSFPERDVQELKTMERRLLQNEHANLDLSCKLTGAFSVFFKDRMFYLACPQCRKKLQLRSDSKYFCPKCKEAKEPNAKYLLSGSFGDRSGVMQPLIHSDK